MLPQFVVRINHQLVCAVPHRFSIDKITVNLKEDHNEPITLTGGNRHLPSLVGVNSVVCIENFTYAAFVAALEGKFSCRLSIFIFVDHTF